MSGAPVFVEVSQDQLYFLVPVTATLVENVLDITNRMTDPRDVVTFKVLSTVEHRYGLSDPVGIIQPGSTITLHITLDPRVTQKNDAAAAALPAKGTTDVMYFDFAVVPAGTQLRSTADAVAFWRRRGPVRGASAALALSPSGGGFTANGSSPAATQRIRLPCLFTTKDEVPGYLQLRQVSPNTGLTSVSRHRSPRCAPSAAEKEADSSGAEMQERGPIWRRIWQLRVSYSTAALFLATAVLCCWHDITHSGGFAQRPPLNQTATA
eukprot:gene1947-1185_t